MRRMYPYIPCDEFTSPSKKIAFICALPVKIYYTY